MTRCSGMAPSWCRRSGGAGQGSRLRTQGSSLTPGAGRLPVGPRRRGPRIRLTEISRRTSPRQRRTAAAPLDSPCSLGTPRTRVKRDRSAASSHRTPCRRGNRHRCGRCRSTPTWTLHNRAHHHTARTHRRHRWEQRPDSPPYRAPRSARCDRRSFRRNPPRRRTRRSDAAPCRIVDTRARCSGRQTCRRRIGRRCSASSRARNRNRFRRKRARRRQNPGGTKRRRGQ